MSVYLDASVLVSLIQIEGESAAVMQFLDDVAVPLMVSDFAAGEVASAISRLVRTAEIDATTAIERLATFDEWMATATRSIATEASDIRLAARLVRCLALGLRMPDAIHLAAAQVRDITLATRDRRLATAAKHLGVAVVIPQAMS